MFTIWVTSSNFTAVVLKVVEDLDVELVGAKEVTLRVEEEFKVGKEVVVGTVVLEYIEVEVVVETGDVRVLKFDTGETLVESEVNVELVKFVEEIVELRVVKIGVIDDKEVVDGKVVVLMCTEVEVVVEPVDITALNVDKVEIGVVRKVNVELLKTGVGKVEVNVVEIEVIKGEEVIVENVEVQ